MQKRKTNSNNILFFSLLSLLATARTTICSEPLSPPTTPFNRFTLEKYMLPSSDRLISIGLSKALDFSVNELLDIKKRGEGYEIIGDAIRDNSYIQDLSLGRIGFDLIRLQMQSKGEENFYNYENDHAKYLDPTINIALSGLGRLILKKTGAGQYIDRTLKQYVTRDEKKKSYIEKTLGLAGITLIKYLISTKKNDFTSNLQFNEWEQLSEKENQELEVPDNN